jgi:hypothetical protein
MKSSPILHEQLSSSWSIGRVGALFLGVTVWQAAWLLAAYLATGGREYSDDAHVYALYIDDPTMLLSDRHRALFGAAVAAPLLPVELKVFHAIFASAGDFLAFRMTMLVHLVTATTIGFAFAFRHYSAPVTWQSWFWAAVVSVVPVAWVTSVITVQDDSVAAGWAGLSLAAYMWFGPLAAAVAAGFGMFFGKVFLALAFLGLWIATPGRRWQIAAVGGAFVAGLFTFLLWRDREFLYSQYVYQPYLGASIYSLVWLAVGEFDILVARNISLVATVSGFVAFTWIAVRRQLSLISAVTGLHALFLMTYFGAMPEYYVWFLPFLVATLWAAYRRRLWATFTVGWLSTFFAYAYKVFYGINPRYEGRKPGLKEWVAENIPFDIHALQIAVGIAAVFCTVAFAILVLLRDPTRQAGIDPLRAGTET